MQHYLLKLTKKIIQTMFTSHPNRAVDLFANLFFLILNLLLISSVFDQTTAPFFKDTPGQAFIFFLFSYGIFLWYLYLQTPWLHKRFRKETILLISNLEILLFFTFFYFSFGSHLWIIKTFNPFGITFLSLLSLTLYFKGLFICHYSLERIKNPPKKAFKNSWMAICFLLPFIIPFLALASLSEASNLTTINHFFQKLEFIHHPIVEMIVFTFLNLAFVTLTIILLPPLAIFIWQCPQLENSSLKNELEDLCQRAHFKHAGLRIWKIMNNSMTAAIIGVIGKLRYVLFTQKLLDQVPNRCVTAILAHEIGHSYHKHLFFYPFILMGMVVLASLAPMLIYHPSLHLESLELNTSTLVSLISFVLFGLTMAVYFRFVFGYFSRIFERQADLHIFKLDIPASHMTEALNLLAISAGNIHLEPNWHHYSIQQRIDFINHADKDRSLIQTHARRVHVSLMVYFSILVFLVALLSLNTILT